MQIDSKLLGSWIADSVEFQGSKMTFRENGKLIYEIHEKGKIGLMYLTFETQGDWIISNQPSNPKPEKTKYNIQNNILTLEHEGVISKYKKIE